MTNQNTSNEIDEIAIIAFFPKVHKCSNKSSQMYSKKKHKCSKHLFTNVVISAFTNVNIMFTNVVKIYFVNKVLLH